MAGMQGRDNKKREPWQYAVLAALLLAVWFLPQMYELRDNIQTVRVAVAPIKVWKNLVPEHECVILPLQLYTTNVPMYPDTEKHPESHGWYNVVSTTCHGSALVGSGR